MFKRKIITCLGPQKKMMKDCRFRMDERIKFAELPWCQQPGMDVIHQLRCHWDACNIIHGN
jgi:hypothetical protein